MYCVILPSAKLLYFINFDEYNLFDILLLLFKFLIFNLVFNHFFLIFHIFFGKYILSYDSSNSDFSTADLLVYVILIS